MRRVIGEKGRNTGEVGGYIEEGYGDMDGVIYKC